jgi:hypothetical protein
VRKSFTITAALIYTGLALLLCGIPLFNSLGFEFSVAVAVTGSLVAGFGTILSLRQPEGIPYTTESFFRQLNSLLRHHLLLLLIPLAIVTLNILFVPNCGIPEGLLFYLLIPAVTVIFAVISAGFLYTCFTHAKLAYTALLGICFAYPLFTGYFAPSIYSYNFIYGFFPGITYDEVIRVTPELLMSRGITLLCCMVMVLLGERLLEPVSSDGKFLPLLRALITGRHRWQIILLSGLLVALWFVRTDLGLESSNESILERLNRKIETEHFTICFAPGSFSKEEIESVAAEHEFRFAQVSQELGTDTKLHVTSFIYPDEETKRKYTGAGATNIAKPWRSEIHLNRNSWRDVLKHELVHVCAAEFGMPVIRAHYNIGLVEGLATAVDNQFGNLTLVEYGAGLKKFGLLKDPRQITNPLRFATHASSISYVGMGSLCRYLLDVYGVERFKAMYGGMSAESAYGKSLEALSVEWWDHLDHVPLTPEVRDHFNYYFARPSIFARVCARSIAAMNEEGWRRLAVNNSTAALADFSGSVNRVWNSEGFTGLVRAAFQAGRYDTVLRLTQGVKDDTLRRAALQGLLLMSGDALWYNGKFAEADSAYETMRRLNISERSNDAADLRRVVLRDTMLRLTLAGWFRGDWSDSLALGKLKEPGSGAHYPVCAYLTARTYVRMGRYEGAVRILQDTIMRRLDPSLTSGRSRLLGQTLLAAKRIPEALVAFEDARPLEVSARGRGRLQENIDRCRWLLQGGMGLPGQDTPDRISSR